MSDVAWRQDDDAMDAPPPPLPPVTPAGMGRAGLALLIGYGMSTDAIARRFGVPIPHIAMLRAAFGLPSRS
jgi:hypothetical protein